jgi:hypothetical protein
MYCSIPRIAFNKESELPEDTFFNKPNNLLAVLSFTWYAAILDKFSTYLPFRTRTCALLATSREIASTRRCATDALKKTFEAEAQIFSHKVPSVAKQGHFLRANLVFATPSQIS